MTPRRSHHAMAAALVGLGLVVAGCESTQDKAKRLAKQGKHAFSAKGLSVTRENPNVKVLSTATLKDANGAAAVVRLRNLSRAPLINVPLAIDVRSSSGRSLFRNDAAGLAPSLTQAAAIPAGGELTWVDDQIVASAAPASVTARAGTTATRAPKALPKLEVDPPKLATDPVSGIAAEGVVHNRSAILQRKLVLFAVARRGGRVVAAGRGGIDKLKPGKKAAYQIFFIGNPKGAKVEVTAPPTVLQ